MSMAYIPTPGPLPGTKWTPSNASDGCAFTDQWCARCARDKAMREGLDIEECDDNELCEIISAAINGEAVEWRKVEVKGHWECVCTAFVWNGDPIPEPRCERTPDMFGDAT